MKAQLCLKSALVLILIALAPVSGYGHSLQKIDKITVIDTNPQDNSGSAQVISGVPAAVVPGNLKRPLHAMLVDKSTQRLHLYFYALDGKVNLVRSFPCSTGRSDGDKVREGDRRTPEGIYFFTKAYYDNKVTIFGTTAFHLNYPDPFDQAEGREGNGIYLHGTNRPLGSRDTNGCVVMNNPDLDYLRQRIVLNDTPIIITPKLRWISREQLDRDREKLQEDMRSNFESWSQSTAGNNPKKGVYDPDQVVMLRQNGRTLIRTPVFMNSALAGWKNIYLNNYEGSGAVLASLWMPKGQSGFSLARDLTGQTSREQLLSFLQGWVKAWESRNVNEYMKYYSKRFRAYGMNYWQWRGYKRKLARKYKAIDVQISGIKIKISGSRAVISFRQQYYSDKFHDDGTKEIRLTHESGGWKIRREDWSPAETMEAKK